MVETLDSRGNPLSSSIDLQPGSSTVGGSADSDLVVPGCPNEILCVVDLAGEAIPRQRRATITSAVFGAVYNGEQARFGVPVDHVPGAVFEFSGFRVIVDGTSEPFFAAGPAGLFAGGVGAPAATLLAQLPAMPKPGISRPVAVFGLGFAGLVVATLAALQPAGQAVSPMDAMAANAVPMDRLTTPEAVSEAVRRRLLEIGALVPTDISIQPDKVEVNLAGRKGEDELITAVVDEIRARTDIPLVTKAPIDESILRLVAAVTFSPVRMVIGRDGKTYAEGDSIGGEWQVASIGQDRVLLQRGQEQVFVTIGDAGE